MIINRSSVTSIAAGAAVLAVIGVACAAPRRAPAAKPDKAPSQRAAAKPAPKPAPAGQQISYEKEIAPTLTRLCSACHGPKQAIGGINFAAYKTEADVLQARDIWQHVADQLQSGAMPPKKLPQPTDAERKKLVAWIQSTVSTVDCDVKEPGRVTIRRLNRTEYNNTIRDLFGVDIKPADAFPSDDVGYGFDNIGDVLTISPLLMEKYMTAAERVAEAVVQAPENHRPITRYEAEKVETQAPSGIQPNGFRLLYGNGEVAPRHQFAAGEYLIRARVYGEQGGPELPRLVIRVGGKDVKSFDVKAQAEEPAVLEVQTHVPAGSHAVAAAFVNDYYFQDPEKKRRREDRNLAVDYIEIEGPLRTTLDVASLPEPHRRLVIARPTGPSWEPAARKVIAGFLPRAYRRPVTAAETDRLVRYVNLAQKQGESFERGVQLAVTAALVSPHFLFRVELDPAAKPTAAGKRPLNDYQLASRLSYFLWSSMPDARLFSLAANGSLKRADVLVAEGLRMLKDPRAGALVENFGAQWLHLRLLDGVSPGASVFPGFNESLRRAMRSETELFFSAIMREDRPILEFLDADFTFVNERLAKHYGIEGVQGEAFRKVPAANGRRGGLVTQASILTLTSNPTRTSPVKRGRWVLEQLLGAPPPPPPPDVPALEEGRRAESKGTLRQRMIQHRENPACAVCHEKMDTLGFGLENYDGVGAWRETEGEFPIDASGELEGGKKFASPAELKQILKGEQDAFSRNFTRRLLIYGLGRGLENYDRCSVDDMTAAIKKNGFRFSEVVRQVILSEPFRFQKTETVGKK